MEQVVQKLATKVKPLVPLQVKRTVKRRVPPRYWRYFDPEWHRRAIGYVEEWDVHGPRQLEFLQEQGLKPEHYLLDVGCGPLRGGVHFIAYLEPGHYYGVDRNAKVLETARELELKRYGVEDKNPTLVAMDNFDFARLGQTFDYMWAQSVFTHLPLNNIIRAVVNAEQALKPGGKFLATFYAPRCCTRSCSSRSSRSSTTIRSTTTTRRSSGSRTGRRSTSSTSVTGATRGTRRSSS